MPPTPRNAPYTPGEAVKCLYNGGGLGTVLTDGTVTDVAAVDGGGFRIDVTYPLSSSPDGLGRARYYTDDDGRCDALSAGKLGECFDCGGPLDVQRDSFSWRGPRDEAVHAPTCPVQVTCMDCGWSGQHVNGPLQGAHCPNGCTGPVVRSALVTA